MKAGINGILNLSILDGWFDEAFEFSGGWAVGDREPYLEEQDETHASAIYSLLENEIVPMYYRDRDRGVPELWMRRVKQSLMGLSPQFNCNRMIGQYAAELYRPAQAAFRSAASEDFAPVRQYARWLEKVRDVWERIRFVEVGPVLSNPALSGQAISLHAVVDLAGLSPADVRVEGIVGPVSNEGMLRDTTVISMPPLGERDGCHIFSHEYVPEQTGRLGYAVRISPNHCDDPLTRPCSSFLRWA
jgi:starch phosphorylase